MLVFVETRGRLEGLGFLVLSFEGGGGGGWSASRFLSGGVHGGAFFFSAWSSPDRQKGVRLEGRPLSATPVLCGLIALAVLVDSYLQHRNAVGVALAAATLTTVIARTVLTFRENTQMTERVRLLASTDSLTGLWNRRG